MAEAGEGVVWRGEEACGGGCDRAGTEELGESFEGEHICVEKVVGVSVDCSLQSLLRCALCL